MKIVHILDNLDRGGAQTMLCSVIAGLSERGHWQHVICLNEVVSADVVDAVKQAGATVEVIGRKRMYALVGFWHIVADLRRLQPDLVHTQLPWGDLIGRTAARIAGARPIVSTTASRYAHKPRIQLMLDRITTRWVARVVFVSAEIVPFSIAHEGVRPEQVLVVPNGIVFDGRDRTEAAAALRDQYGAGARIVIGMVARLHPKKAHQNVIKAFAEIASARSDVRLWLVGDGPERARLQGLVRDFGLEDRVVFALDRNDVGDWLAAMDIFVHPTLSEGLPLAVLEAMDAGKPVIASPVDGVKGLIVPGVHGWLVPPDQPEALAAAIRYVIDHPEQAARVGQAGAERVRAQFGVDRVVCAYDELFTSVLAAPAPAIARI